MGALRLINRTETMVQLLAAIAVVPVGVKLSIPQLRDALVSQADVIAGIEALIIAGEIEAATLRPAVVAERQPTQPRSGGELLRRGQAAHGEPAQALFDALKAEGARRGLSVQATSVAVFANPSRIYSLKRPGCRVQPKTADRIHAWIATAPAGAEGPLEAVDKGAGGDDSPPPAPEPVVTRVPVGPGLDEVTPALLHREIKAFLDRSGVSATAFGKAVNGDAGLVRQIKAGRAPRAKTLVKIRAILADPPAGLVASKAPLGDRRSAEHRRDPADKPDTPLMDLNDQRSTRNARSAAGVNRSNAREAEKRLSGEKVGGVQSPAVRAAMNTIRDRDAAQARQTDPVESAKLALQQKGRTVYASSVIGGPQNRFVVSGMGKEVTPAAMIAEAERVTGKSFRREASR